jgi:hypothetical protein
MRWNIRALFALMFQNIAVIRPENLVKGHDYAG